ncbi:hypothetical protein H7K45_25680 [Mycobacterium yunnanensis]|uniref:Uncharacterized protein n=1 Tax=Mycobacterium yunnanensis TaxID=368477 RepID=A0A9X2Z6F3_9MYCO|nr:hypothetical protein [Mycobacterium yunnanensis]MCV7423948.1 hypothetical protein [Mycobacterium yunnanensis]
MVEYDGFTFHGDPDRSDATDRSATLHELDWNVMSIASDDVRRRPVETVRRIDLEWQLVWAA